MDRRAPPFLLRRFPGLVKKRIKEAHAYASGGAIVRDLCYCTFGCAGFSTLESYVRSGDFVRESQRRVMMLRQLTSISRIALCAATTTFEPPIRPIRGPLETSNG